MPRMVELDNGKRTHPYRAILKRKRYGLDFSCSPPEIHILISENMDYATEVDDGEGSLRELTFETACKLAKRFLSEEDITAKPSSTSVQSIWEAGKRHISSFKFTLEGIDKAPSHLIHKHWQTNS